MSGMFIILTLTWASDVDVDDSVNIVNQPLLFIQSEYMKCVLRLHCMRQISCNNVNKEILSLWEKVYSMLHLQE